MGNFFYSDSQLAKKEKYVYKFKLFHKAGEYIISIIKLLNRI